MPGKVLDSTTDERVLAARAADCARNRPAMMLASNAHRRLAARHRTLFEFTTLPAALMAF
jgi:hypothetical protein